VQPLLADFLVRSGLLQDLQRRKRRRLLHHRPRLRLQRRISQLPRRPSVKISRLHPRRGLRIAAPAASRRRTAGGDEGLAVAPHGDSSPHRDLPQVQGGAGVEDVRGGHRQLRPHPQRVHDSHQQDRIFAFFHSGRNHDPEEDPRVRDSADGAMADQSATSLSGFECGERSTILTAFYQKHKSL
jgi:hypothetical protein